MSVRANQAQFKEHGHSSLVADWAVVLGMVALLCAGFFILIAPSLIGDELVHYAQVQNFWRTDWILERELTLIAGFHAIAAMMTGWLPGEALWQARLSNVVLGAATLWVFRQLLRCINPSADRRLRVLQLSVLPVVFPFWFLTYTEVAGLLGALAVLWLAVANKPYMAGTMGVFAMLMRQSHVAWLLCGAAITLARAWSERLSWARVFGRLSVYLIGFAAFLVFVGWNGGISLAQQEMHPTGALSLSSVWFLVFVLWAVFLPLHIQNLSAVTNLLKRHWSVWLLLPVLAALLALTFEVAHPYNQLVPEINLRNWLLLQLESSILARALLSLVCFWSVLSLAATSLGTRWHYALFPISALFVSMHWLIDARYTLVPIVLFLAVLPRQTSATEVSLLGWWIFLSATILVGVVTGEFWVL